MKNIRRSLALGVSFTLLAVGVYACGGDDSTTTPADAGGKDSSVADTGTADTSVKPDGNVLDSGTLDTGAADTSVADAADAAEAGPLNGCAVFADKTAANDPRAISFPGAFPFAYTPSCIKISKGQKVTWNADSAITFAGHPLQNEGEPGTPIVATSTGTTVSFTFNQTGTFGFHCLFHPVSMKGAILVQ